MKSFVNILIAALFAITQQVRIPGPGGLVPSSGAATITLTQSKSAVSGAVSQFSVTFDSNVANGDLVISCTTFGNNVSNTNYAATDNKSGGTNSYAAFATVMLTISGNSDLWCAWTIHAGSAQAMQETITVTGSGGSHTMRMAIFDYHSTTGWPANPVDKNNGGSNASSGTSGNPGNITPSVSNTLIFSALQLNTAGVTGINVGGCCVEQTAGGNAHSGWASSARADGSDNQSGTTSTQTASYTWTGNAPYSALIQNFKPN